MNLAIISPNKNTYSETFIQAHKNIKADKVFFYYGGTIPTALENVGTINITKSDLRLKTLIKLGVNLNPFLILKDKFTIKETLFTQSLKKNKVDVVLAEYGPTGVACMNVCKKLEIPLITHFHGFDISLILPQYIQKYKTLFENSSYLIAVSKEMASTLISIGAPKEKIIYTPCGPSDIFFDIRPQFNSHNFLSVGRFVDKKAPYYVILAFNKLLEFHPDAKLFMVGNGPLLNACENLVKYLKIENNVCFKGIQTSTEIKELMENSVAFVQHSITTADGDKEGTPVGVMEASASAIPVISTYHAGIPDVVEHGKTGLLCKEHDVEGMSSNMKMVLDDTNIARRLGESGRIKIKDNFTLSHHLSILSATVKKAYEENLTN